MGVFPKGSGQFVCSKTFNCFDITLIAQSRRNGLKFLFRQKSHHSVVGVISHIEYVENPFMSYNLWKKRPSAAILEWKRALVRMNYRGQNGCHFAKLHAKIFWRHGMHDLLPVHLVNDVVVITQNWCECKAGKSGCSQSIGLLYLLVHFQRTNLETVSEVQSKTSLPQTWHLLRKGRFLDTTRNVANYTRKYSIKHSVSLDIELFLVKLGPTYTL